LQRLFVGHAELHEPAQLLHVQSVGGVDGIRADEQPRTGPVRLLRGYEITFDVIAQILSRLRGEFVSVVGAIEIVLIVIDGWRAQLYKDDRRYLWSLDSGLQPASR